MTPSVVVSRRGADRIRTLHPWIFRSDVVEAAADPGDLVRVTTDRGRPVGWAFWSSTSQIALRMVSTSSALVVDEPGWLAGRVRAAAAYRASLRAAARARRAELSGWDTTVARVSAALEAVR